MTPPVVSQVQRLLDEGKPPADVARDLDLKVDTVRKAILAGRLHRPGAGARGAGGARSKSERSVEDEDAGMG